MNFGGLLKRFRERRQLTLRDLGKLTGLDHAYIFRLESGQKDMPSADTINRLTKAIKLTPREVSVLLALLEYPAPESLADYAIAQLNQDMTDIKILSRMCDPHMGQQTDEIWTKLLKEIRVVRRKAELLSTSPGRRQHADVGRTVP